MVNLSTPTDATMADAGQGDGDDQERRCGGADGEHRAGGGGGGEQRDDERGVPGDAVGGDDGAGDGELRDGGRDGDGGERLHGGDGERDDPGGRHERDDPGGGPGRHGGGTGRDVHGDAEQSGGGDAGDAATGTGTITNDDVVVPTVSIGPAMVAEGNSGTTNAVFPVTLSAATTVPVTVSYATGDGTATAGSDYTAVTSSVTIAAGQTSGTITVAVLGDTVVEPDETFTVTLSSPVMRRWGRRRGLGRSRMTMWWCRR